MQCMPGTMPLLSLQQLLYTTSQRFPGPRRSTPLKKTTNARVLSSQCQLHEVYRRALGDLESPLLRELLEGTFRVLFDRFSFKSNENLLDV